MSVSVWILGCLFGFLSLLVLPSPVVGRSFDIVTDPQTGESRYNLALVCKFSQNRVLYPISLFESLHEETAAYTERTSTDCCFKATSRNQCCLYQDGDVTKCKCNTATTCGNPPPPSCKANFFAYTPNTCVGILNEPGTALEARAKCLNADPKKQGFLAKIKTPDFDAFIRKNVLPGVTGGVWFGLQRLTTGGFGWIGNLGMETKLDGTVDQWATSQPSPNPSLNCVKMEAADDFKWFNRDCSIESNGHALCQYKL